MTRTDWIVFVYATAVVPAVAGFLWEHARCAATHLWRAARYHHDKRRSTVHGGVLAMAREHAARTRVVPDYRCPSCLIDMATGELITCVRHDRLLHAAMRRGVTHD